VVFQNLDYISSDKVRGLIDAKKIKELGANRSLNTGLVIYSEVIIGYGIDNNNPTLDNLQKKRIKSNAKRGGNSERRNSTRTGMVKFFWYFVYIKQKKKPKKFFDKIEKIIKTIEIAKMTNSILLF
jgi:iron complex transport system substrate-binding protein